MITSKKKHIIISLCILGAIIIGVIIFISLYISSKQKSPITPSENIQYENDDNLFIPSSDELLVDDTTGAVYFKNVIDVFTFDTLNDEQIGSLCALIDGELIGQVKGTINMLQIKVSAEDLQSLADCSEIMMSSPDVMYASYEYPIIPDNDADNNPWLGKDGNKNDWWAAAIDAYGAWENSDIKDTIKVGIIDSGFDTDHKDLNNKISFLPSYSANTEDDHGTHVAGLIAAQDNSIGIRGIADTADLVCVDWSPVTNDDEDQNYVSYLSNAEYVEIIKQLIEDDVQIINNSWGVNILSKEGYTEDIYGKSNSLLFLMQYLAISKVGSYESYLDYIEALSSRTSLQCLILTAQLALAEKDFVIIQSAGNGYDNGGKGYDASKGGFFCGITEKTYERLSETSRKKLAEKNITYDSLRDHIIVVGAFKNEKDGNGNYRMCSFSNFGVNVDICAPGENILSTICNDQYDNLGGTSMAAPIVSGCAALLWQNSPEKTSAEIKGTLTSSSEIKAVGVGDDNGTLYPIVNIGNVMKKETTALSPESAVNIFLKYKDLWMAYPDYFPMNGYYYGFLDLDFDGNLELIRSINDGSGRYSQNSYYAIDISDYSVYQLSPTDAEIENGALKRDGYDYGLLNDYPLLLKDKNTGKLTYYCADYQRVSAAEYGEAFGTLNLQDKLITTDILYTEHHITAGAYFNENAAAVDEYFYYLDGQMTECTKDQYDAETNAYFDSKQDMELVWGEAPGKELESSQESKQREMLLDIYKQFGYTGFSFEQMNLIDVDVTPTETVSSIEATENDFYDFINYFSNYAVLPLTPVSFDSSHSTPQDVINLLYNGGQCYSFMNVPEAHRIDIDPLNRNPDLAPGINQYYKISETDLAHICEDIFNTKYVRPGDLISDVSGNELVEMYFYDGDFYFHCSPDGDAGEYSLELKEATLTDEGKYNLLLVLQETTIDVICKYNLKVVAGLKEKDGEKYWSIYSWNRDSDYFEYTKTTQPSVETQSYSETQVCSEGTPYEGTVNKFFDSLDNLSFDGIQSVTAQICLDRWANWYFEDIEEIRQMESDEFEEELAYFNEEYGTDITSKDELLSVYKSYVRDEIDEDTNDETEYWVGYFLYKLGVDYSEDHYSVSSYEITDAHHATSKELSDLKDDIWRSTSRWWENVDDYYSPNDFITDAYVLDISVVLSVNGKSIRGSLPNGGLLIVKEKGLWKVFLGEVFTSWYTVDT